MPRNKIMTKDGKREKFIYKRICVKCKEFYKPTGRTQKICEECKQKN